MAIELAPYFIELTAAVAELIGNLWDKFGEDTGETEDKIKDIQDKVNSRVNGG